MHGLQPLLFGPCWPTHLHRQHLHPLLLQGGCCLFQFCLHQHFLLAPLLLYQVQTHEDMHTQNGWATQMPASTMNAPHCCHPPCIPPAHSICILHLCWTKNAAQSINLGPGCHKKSSNSDFNTIISSTNMNREIQFLRKKGWELGHKTREEKWELKAYLYTFNVTHMLNNGEGICHDLTGMVVICQAIDYWDLCIVCQIQQVLWAPRKLLEKSACRTPYIPVLDLKGGGGGGAVHHVVMREAGAIESLFDTGYKQKNLGENDTKGAG